jgi:hypothetical protein
VDSEAGVGVAGGVGERGSPWCCWGPYYYYYFFLFKGHWLLCTEVSEGRHPARHSPATRRILLPAARRRSLGLRRWRSCPGRQRCPSSHPSWRAPDSAVGSRGPNCRLQAAVVRCLPSPVCPLPNDKIGISRSVSRARHFLPLSCARARGGAGRFSFSFSLSLSLSTLRSSHYVRARDCESVEYGRRDTTTAVSSPRSPPRHKPRRDSCAPPPAAPLGRNRRRSRSRSRRHRLRHSLP